MDKLTFFQIHDIWFSICHSIVMSHAIMQLLNGPFACDIIMKKYASKSDVGPLWSGNSIVSLTQYKICFQYKNSHLWTVPDFVY